MVPNKHFLFVFHLLHNKHSESEGSAFDADDVVYNLGEYFDNATNKW